VKSSFVTKTAALVRKDLRIELRGRDTLLPMIAFSLSVALLLAFTLPAASRIREPISTPFGTVATGRVIAGFLWVTILFAGLIGFARTFEVERRNGVLDALLLAPLDRAGLFVAKAIANLAFLVMIEVVLCPVFLLFFSPDLGSEWTTLILVLVLTDIAFAAIGTLFASLASQTTSRELILPILALPILVPVFIGATELTADIFMGAGLDIVAASGWFGILIAFDIVAVVAGVLSFDYVLD
jgi:heme exporter protein B